MIEKSEVVYNNEVQEVVESSFSPGFRNNFLDSEDRRIAQANLLGQEPKTEDKTTQPSIPLSNTRNSSENDLVGIVHFNIAQVQAGLKILSKIGISSYSNSDSSMLNSTHFNAELGVKNDNFYFLTQA